MNRPLPAAIVSVCASVLATVPAVAQDDLELKVTPFKTGVSEWEQTGKEKAFAWEGEEAVLEIRGQSGDEPPRLLFKPVAWPTLEATFRLKKGARGIELALVPDDGGDPVRLEVPKDAAQPDKWNEVTLVVDGSRAVLAGGADGAELAAVDVPAGKRWKVAFEAPRGAKGEVTDLRLKHVYVDDPQVCEEGFTSLFNGATLGPWGVQPEGAAGVVGVENGLLTAEVRMSDYAMLAYRGGLLKAYELRFRVLWTTTGLTLRAVEVAGMGGKISKMASVQVPLKDHLSDRGPTDFVVRVADGKCVMTANGRTIMDESTSDFETTPLSFILGKGEKAQLRDIRLKNLAPGDEPAGGGAEGGGLFEDE